MANNKKQQPSRALQIVRSFFPGVKRVADSKHATWIDVTNEDNQSSKSLDHRHCALAVACKRGLRADGVIIGTRTAYIINGHMATRYRLQESTAREIVSFDRRAGFAPGSYLLQAPAKGEQLGGGYTGKTRNASDRKTRMRHVTANIRTILGSGGVKSEEVAAAPQ